MISAQLLIFSAAFFLAQEKERAPYSYTHFAGLKDILIQALHLSWQSAVLALLCLGLRQLPFGPEANMEKGICLAAAWLLTACLCKSVPYFTVLGALGLVLTEVLGQGWQQSLLWLAQTVAGISGLQALFLGIKERLVLAKIPQAFNGMPVQLAAYFLVLLAVWALQL